jgi:hypothetical protein
LARSKKVAIGIGIAGVVCFFSIGAGFCAGTLLGSEVEEHRATERY